ncbi:hypothetical protein [Planosporangium mesophilum]|uniref:Uncharacterized protein n=1 Tax=Planosporangium mesophilum TaxID=689768 RepID=A0A8J3THV0_9ACTN|nr:hypothetical protein [Planosporangium mesophilum]NJC85993.1 hypothetical protein [Planosporangium mesophilum]GII25906.1 hypothetical protein Pme01_55030 [Planosporangium mesophilum]
MTSADNALILLAAAPAWAHEAPAGGLTTWDATVVRCLILVAGALVGGLGLLRPLTGPVNAATRRIAGVAAVVAAAGLLQMASSGRASWWVAGAQALVLPAVAAVLGRPVVAAVGGLVVTGTLAVEAVPAGGWVVLAVGVAHAAAGSVWVAAATAVAAADPGTRAALLRRLAPVAVGAAVLVAATGAAQARLDGLRPDATTVESAYGRVVALKAVLLAGAAGLGLLAHRRLVRRRPAHRRVPGGLPGASALGLAGALVAGAALAAVEAPPAPPVPGVPLLRSVATGTTRLPVVVVPQRPGWNLVHVGAVDAAVGVDRSAPVPATPRPGVTGGWAAVRLPVGKSRLWVRQGGRLASLRLDTGRTGTGRTGTGRTGTGRTGTAVPTDGITGPDGPECVSAVLGYLAAGQDRTPDTCPADRLADRDAASLRALVAFLAGRGVRTVTVLDDPSPRSRTAAGVVRDAAALHGVELTPAPRPDSTVVVVSGWSAGDATVRGVARGEVPGAGTYLAPWLANARLLGYGSGAVVALRYDPRDPLPLRYAKALRDAFAGEPATAAGYENWLEAAGATAGPAAGAAAGGPVHLYAAATVSYLPAQFAHDHGVRGGWLPGGAITKVTPPLVE